jgi:hypothetical protein
MRFSNEFVTWNSARESGTAMKYYVWVDDEGRSFSRAWRYEDETERMTVAGQTPTAEAILRAGTRQQLAERYGLHDEDFAE